MYAHDLLAQQEFAAKRIGRCALLAICAANGGRAANGVHLS
jgi:hypothetical protein